MSDEEGAIVCQVVTDDCSKSGLTGILIAPDQPTGSAMVPSNYGIV
jgi:hypothetical protein